jgi:hypothetical protein
MIHMSYRYDIKHDWYTDKWQVVDTRNRDCAVSTHDTREEALREAKLKG